MPGDNADRVVPARHLRRVRDGGAHAGGGRDARLLSSRRRALRAARQPDRGSQDHQPRSRASTSRRSSTASPGAAPIPSPLDELVYTAAEVVPLLAERFARFFPGLDIRVELVDDIASKAAAGVDGVRIKRGGRFSRRDLAQLEFHEGHVHVATALNGRAQPVMPFIGYPSPRTTGDAGRAGGADRVPDPVDQPGAAAPARRPHAGDQDGRGRRRLLPAVPVLPGPRPRRIGGLRLRAPRLPRRSGRGRRAVHQGRLLPGRPAAGDELPARRAGEGAPRLRAAVLRRQDRRRGRAAVRAADARGDRDRRPTTCPTGRAICRT